VRALCCTGSNLIRCDNDTLFANFRADHESGDLVLNTARGRTLTCACLCIGLSAGEGRTQLTANERRAPAGDAPADAGAPDDRHLARGAARAYASRDAEGGRLAVCLDFRQ